MAQSQHGPRRHRWRGVHLVWALATLVVFSACGSALVGSDSKVAMDGELGLGLVGGPSNGRSEISADLALDRPVLDNASLGDEAFAASTEASQAGRTGDDALIVRTASLELEVDDVAAILFEARDKLAALGGYVAGSDEYDQGDRRWASVTYRLPVERFSEGIDALRGLSNRVARETTQSQEVTATLVDLDARIANLRASEVALVQIMDRSGRIEDVLAVQLRLEDVRGQIERLEAQRSNLANQAALSTLVVTWFTPVAAVTVAQEGWDLGSEVDAALAQTLQALQGAASFGVWAAVVGLPLLGIPLLVVLIVLLVLRRRMRGSGTGSDSASSAVTTPSE